MALLMDSADLYLTKPGGISVTEAASMRLPMVFIDAVSGCEEYNKDFFLRTGGAVTGQTPREIARTSLSLLSNEPALEKWATRSTPPCRKMPRPTFSRK